MIKKLSLLSLLALSATSTVAAEGRDSRFTFLSGGATFFGDGLAREFRDENDIEFLEKYKVTKGLPKKSSFGAYLSGAYSFDNNVFLEGGLRYLAGRNVGYFAGVGYYYSLDAQQDIYVLGGISQFGTFISR